MVYQALGILQQLLLPATCILCGGKPIKNKYAGEPSNANDSSKKWVGDLDICAACIRDMPANDNACVQCAEHLPAAGRQSDLCGACLRRPPRFQHTHCAYRYGYPLDHLVRALKYHGRLVYAHVLGNLLARSLASMRADGWPTILIPVPLSAERFRERGFNQAIELGVQLETQLRISMRADLLTRERSTREQAGLDRIGRRKNVRGAFSMQAPLPATHVAIIDDVVTTGSTVNEIARVLHRAGAKRIEVWAVARASR